MSSTSSELQSEQLISRIRMPGYGRYFDDLVPGDVYFHPRGYSFERAEILSFSRTFMQCNPLYLNLEYARAEGYPDIPASPQMVFNVVLSLGVQNDSEKALANLGYYNVRFLKSVFPGDTLNARTRVIDARDRGADKPGIVTIRTVGINQNNELVLQYERKVMVMHDPRGPGTARDPQVDGDFPWIDAWVGPADLSMRRESSPLTGNDTYFEDFEVGDVIVHPNGRTVTDEHMALTYMFGNTHPLHFDRLYSSGRSGKMSGEPIVYGGLVFAWLDGLSSRDLSENAIGEMGFTEGYHTQPTCSGDTLSVISRISEVRDYAGNTSVGVVVVQQIGFKNITATNALETWGEEVFINEGAKRGLGLNKLEHKVFEVERSFLIKRRPGESE